MIKKEHNVCDKYRFDRIIKLSNGIIYLQGGLPVPCKQINIDLIALSNYQIVTFVYLQGGSPVPYE